MYVLSFQIQLLDIHTLETDINLYVYLTIDVVLYVFLFVHLVFHVCKCGQLVSRLKTLRKLRWP